MASFEKTLPVVPLENKVLLPSVILKVTLKGEQATQLVRRHFKAQQENRRGHELHLACVPLRTAAGVSDDDDDIHGVPQATPLAPSPIPPENIPKQLVPLALRPNLSRYACMGRIVRVQRLDVGVYGIFLEGITRVHIESFRTDPDGFLLARTKSVGDVQNTATEEMVTFKALAREFVDKMRHLQIPESLVQQLAKLVESRPSPVMADMLVCVIETSFEEKLQMLSNSNVKERLAMATEWMTRQLHVLRISEQIHSSVEGNLSKKQREFYLRQQLEAIKKELGESSEDNSDKDEDDVAQLNRRLVEAKLPNEALAVAQRELKRLQRLQPSSAEWSVVRNYLELMADMPWSKQTNAPLDLGRAKQQLEGDHFGLAQVKKRIIEYLAVLKVKGDMKAPIICFVGPPGVGKTSLGKSIATALGRKFHRIALGGVRDEADLRGHRRTYVGAMPGLIIQSLRRCGVNNPVFLLDEVDKLVHSSIHGDPAAALLEVLDPEQNHTFSDHYLNVPYDLSNIMFIATANSLDTIPAPLLDRMEVIHLHGYTFEEKLHIAQTHLLPKQISQHGLGLEQVILSDDVLLKVAEQYTRESGVRSLERTLASIVRGKCVQLADLRDHGHEFNYKPRVDMEEVREILGVPVYEKEVAERDAVAGVVTGLAYSGSGNGGILFVESTKMPGKGSLSLTGSLGDVIKESAQIALTWVKAHAYELKIATTATTNLVEQHDVHIHFPHGAVPKDGPSAGVTLVCSLVSLFSTLCVSPTTAMTGEISLRGQVLPVGGIKEKVISAHRAGIRKIILPERNRKDVEADVPESVKADILFVFARTIWDVLDAAGLTPIKAGDARPFESHL